MHDTLLQREEELARLQEENQKLRQFLNSSLVKDLEEKAKTLCANGKRKRNLSFFTPPISKRVCRNLTAEICSESEPSETSLDLWVLKTLGLKDKDTIDTGADHNNTITNHYHSPLEHNTDSCNVYQSPITAIMLQASPNPSENQDGKDSGFANVSTVFSSSKDYNSTCYTYSNGQSPNISFTMEKSQPEVSQWPLPFHTTINYSPMERLHFLPKFCSTPKKSNQNGASLMRSSRPVLAFSMSLSPNHSLKTHSFPHGQAFVRRDTKGRCSFTWVPRDRP
ncbi:hypothetical protein NQD34_009874 [Periophthalmus magnuspinnatus]|nr:hypothetical protein NQD34_009874 [Periophthalmus magnuspinnatus]